MSGLLIRRFCSQGSNQLLRSSSSRTGALSTKSFSPLKVSSQQPLAPLSLINRQKTTSTSSRQNQNLTSSHNVSVTSSGPSVPAFSFPCEKTALTRLYETHAGPQAEHAFFVNDLGVVERQYKRWVDNLPNVKPFYAVKCNPDPVLLKSLAAQGASFDCASGAEIEAVLATGVHPDNIIFANPIKNVRDLKYARKVGVTKMTFDNVDELHKIAQHHPQAQLVLRLLPDDSGSLMRFGVKFGAPLPNIPNMLDTVKQLNLSLIGCSFHIGSGCFDANKYNGAIKLAKDVFTMAESKGLPKLSLLDLGGGFPGNPVPNAQTPAEGGRMTPAFEEFAAVIRKSIDEFFPPSSGVTVIAEPGRYMATAWSTLFTIVQGKREEPVPADAPAKKFLYYINDGVYGSFNCLMFDHAHPVPVPAYRFMNDKVALSDQPQQVAFVPQFNTKYRKPLSIHSTLSLNLNNASSSSESVNQNLVSARAASTSAPSAAPSTLGTFFGPTCDSMDVIATDFPIEELHVGDWLAFEQFGAYTSASSTTFNGMERPIHHYVRSAKPSPKI